MEESPSPPPLPPPQIVTHHQPSGVKRASSPILSSKYVHKKICPSKEDLENSGSIFNMAEDRMGSKDDRSVGHGRNRVLPAPNAPTMQQLLVSKDPIVSSDLGSGSNDEKGDHSVLRNLLVSGRDDSTGYNVVPQTSSLLSSDPRLDSSSSLLKKIKV